MDDTGASEIRIAQLAQGFHLASLQVFPQEGLLRSRAGEVQLEPRVMDVLVALAADTQNVVSRERLLEIVWGRSVVSDDAVARCIYVLRHEIQPLLGESLKGNVIDTLRKRGYRLNLPVTSLDAQSFPSSDSVPEGSRHSRLRWRVLALSGLLIAAAGLLVWYQHKPDSPIRSIAVLPFLNLTGDEELAYLADGFSEQLSHALANINGIRVAARTSSFYFKEHPADVPEMAERLNVDVLLEGSIRRQGELLRVTLQLIRSDGFHIWSREYDRTMHDALRLQSEIAQELVSELGFAQADNRVGPGVYYTDNPVAFDLYLRGRYRLANSPRDQYQPVVDLFDQAIEEDPDFALAYTGIADTYSIQLFREPVPEQDQAMIERAAKAIERALTLAPGLAEAHAAQGLYWLALDRYAESEPPLRRAVELNPNYLNAHNWLGLSLVHQDRFSEAISAYRGAQALDPLNLSVNRNLGANLMLVGKFDDGQRYLRRVQELDPDGIDAYRLLASWSGVYGRHEQTLEWVKQGLALAPSDMRLTVFKASTYGHLGLFEKALDTLATLSPDQGLDAMALETHFSVLLAQANWEAMARRQQELAELRTLGDPDSGYGYERVVLRWLMIEALNHQNYARVVELAQRYADSGEVVCGAFGFPGPRMYWALAYRQMGELKRFRQLAEECQVDIQRVIDNGGRYPTALYRLATSQVLAGDADAARQTMEQVFQSGWSAYRFVANDPLWVLLQGEVEMKDALAQLQQRLERDGAGIFTKGL